MVKLCIPEIPETYWVKHYVFQCRNCEINYQSIIPDDSVVKFREVDGDEVRWLPMYGKGGYVYLVIKLMGEDFFNNKVAMATGKAFIEELNKYCEQGEHGKGFDFEGRRMWECPHCGSGDSKELKEEVLVSPELSWLKIDCSLLE